MAEARRYHQVTSPIHAADGMTVLYGPGELHEPGSLPGGVPYTEVVADEAAVAASPVHAQADERDAAVAARKAEFERIQTERSQPAVSDGALATDPVVTGDEQRAGTQQRAAGLRPGVAEADQSPPRGASAKPPAK